MTIVVYFSGVHGSGKTTTRTKVAQRLQKAGMSVYAFPEFSYTPDIPIGTPEFQLWYRIQLRIRQDLIKYLVNKKYFDIIIVDRHPIDEKVYSSRLGGDHLLDYELEANEIHFFMYRHVGQIIDAIRKRMKLEEHAHRKEWNEDDTEYIKKIQKEFMNIYTSFNSVERVVKLVNTFDDDCEAPVNEALKELMRLIK